MNCPCAYPGKSFFKKLFSRSSSSKKSNPEAGSLPPSPPIQAASVVRKLSKSATTATQTSSPEGPELHCSESRTATAGDHKLKLQGNPACNGTEMERHISSHPMILQIDCNDGDSVHENCWNSLPGTERPSSRLSQTTLTDDGNLYSYHTPSGDSHGMNGDSGHPDPTYPFPRGESSRCSNLSRGTSLGYGSQGPASVGVSHSPTPSMSPSNYNGYSGRRSAFGPPPAYSSMMSRNSPNLGSYKTSYEYYKRRYPGYGNYTRQHPTTTSSANCLPTEPPREKPTTTVTMTMTGRPNSQQPNYYEIIGSRNKSTQPDPKTSTMTEPISSSAPKKSENHIRTTFPSPRLNKRKGNEPFVSTTTVTQKSTTNMEVELRLPFGKFSHRGANGRASNGSILINGNDTKLNVNVENCGSECAGGTKIHIGQPRSETEVKTTVSHSSGNGPTVKTHFDCCDRPTKDRNENVGDSNPPKSQPNEPSGPGYHLKSQKIDVVPVSSSSFGEGPRRKSYDFAVNVRDLDRNSNREFVCWVSLLEWCVCFSCVFHCHFIETRRNENVNENKIRAFYIKST